jgi:hypothetical protein
LIFWILRTVRIIRLIPQINHENLFNLIKSRFRQMTRELLFINSFEPQLTTFTTWQSLVAVQSSPKSTLAPSDFPGFEIVPGEATYASYDSLGYPASGVQAFVLRVVFAHSQLAVGAMRSTHSAYASLIEEFFSGGYTPPIVSSGDVVRIDGAQIVKIDPPIVNKTATRTTVTAHATYSFTFF